MLDQPDDGWCAAHNKPEALCEECALARAEGKPLPTVKTGTAKVCREPLPIVRLASAKLAQKIGIQTAEVTEEEHAHRLVANAETAYDANRYAEITPRVSGFIREVKVDLGEAVRQGQVLAVIDSAEVSAAKTQFLSAQAAVKLAQATADRTQALTRSGAVAGKADLEVMTALNQAQASLMDAEQKLRNLGFGDAELAEILKTKDTRNLLNVVAPIDGTVVARHAVKGEAVQATTQLFSDRRHVEDVALDRCLRERHCQGEARPGGELRRLGNRPPGRRPCLARPGDLGRDRGQRQDPHRANPGRADSTPMDGSGRISSARPRFKSAPSTRPWWSRKRRCSGRTTWTSSSSPRAKGPTGRNG